MDDPDVDESELALVEILAGFSCNLKCRFCSIPEDHRRRNKSTEEAKRDIREAKEDGAEILGFTGGEPTVRNDIIELVRYAREQGFRTVRIQTNGMRFADKEFTKEIIEAGANYFKFSIHGHKAEIHDYLVQREGAFEKTVQGLKNIRSFNRTVEVNVVLNSYNYRFLPQIVKFLLDLGTSKFVIIYPSYIGIAEDNMEELFVPMSDVVPYVKEGLEIIQDYDLDKALTVSIPPCLLGEEYVEYASSELTDLRTAVQGPDFKVDLDQKFDDEKVQGEACKECKYYLLCDGVREEYAEYYGLEELEPIEGERVTDPNQVEGQ